MQRDFDNSDFSRMPSDLSATVSAGTLANLIGRLSYESDIDILVVGLQDLQLLNGQMLGPERPIYLCSLRHMSGS